MFSNILDFVYITISLASLGHALYTIRQVTSSLQFLKTPDGYGKAAEHAASAAPCSVSVWRTAGPEGEAVHFVVDKVGSYVHEGADLLDGKYVGRGESVKSIRAWMEKTAALY